MRLLSTILGLAPLLLFPGEHGRSIATPLTYSVPFPSVVSTYQETPFLDLVTWLGSRSFDRSGWSLSVVRHDVRYPLRRAKDVPRRVRDWATSPIGQYKVKAGELREAREKAFFKAHLSEVDTLFQGLTLIGGNLGEFISDDKLPPPIGVAEWNGGKTILVSGVATRLFFPVQTMTVMRRVSEVASTVFLPTLKDLMRPRWPSDITHVGMVIFFGSTDTTEIFETQASELAAFVVSRTDAQHYLDGEITDVDLLRLAAVFVADRSMGNGSVRRMAITLQ